MFEIALVLLALIVVFVLISIVGNKTSGIDRAFYKERWQTIAQLGDSPHAATEADKLLDHALKQLRYRGSTMADRMRAAKPRFSHYDDVWMAHKLRNRIVHEAGHAPKSAEVRRAISTLGRALKDLGAL